MSRHCGGNESRTSTNLLACVPFCHSCLCASGSIPNAFKWHTKLNLVDAARALARVRPCTTLQWWSPVVLKLFYDGPSRICKTALPIVSAVVAHHHWDVFFYRVPSRVRVLH
eukprot:5624587-Pleurochrysis_carterae.AAC.17